MLNPPSCSGREVSCTIAAFLPLGPEAEAVNVIWCWGSVTVCGVTGADVLGAWGCIQSFVDPSGSMLRAQTLVCMYCIIWLRGSNGFEMEVCHRVKLPLCSTSDRKMMMWCPSTCWFSVLHQINAAKAWLWQVNKDTFTEVWWQTWGLQSLFLCSWLKSYG